MVTSFVVGFFCSTSVASARPRPVQHDALGHVNVMVVTRSRDRITEEAPRKNVVIEVSTLVVHVLGKRVLPLAHGFVAAVASQVINHAVGVVLTTCQQHVVQQCRVDGGVVSILRQQRKRRGQTVVRFITYKKQNGTIT